MSGMATAIVCTYLPGEDRVLHTPFTGERTSDPLGMALAFREGEEARGDFPGAIWGVIANDAARELRRRRIMEGLTSVTLSPTGKPLRALQALRDTTPDTAMTEYAVWKSMPSTTPAYSALYTIVKEGLAIRLDHPGPARWYIAEAGARVLAEQEGR